MNAAPKLFQPRMVKCAAARPQLVTIFLEVDGVGRDHGVDGPGQQVGVRHDGGIERLDLVGRSFAVRVEIVRQGWMMAGPDTITDEAGDAHTHDRLHHERPAQQGLREDGIGEPAVDRSG